MGVVLGKVSERETGSAFVLVKGGPCADTGGDVYAPTTVWPRGAGNETRDTTRSTNMRNGTGNDTVQGWDQMKVSRE